MIDGDKKPWISETKIKTSEKLELVENITTNESGITEYLVKPGQFVKKGTAVAKITNVIGKIEEIIFAHRDYYIISLNDFSVSFPGSGLLSVATISPKIQHEENKTAIPPKGR